VIARLRLWLGKAFEVLPISIEYRQRDATPQLSKGHQRIQRARGSERH
jgi:hypothetical protein